jgi:D-alanyl-D-alanine carboxypeptidase
VRFVIKRKIRRRKGMSRKRRMVGVLMSEIMVCVICVIVAAGIVRTSVSAEGKFYINITILKINQNNDDLKNDSSTDAGTKWNLILVNSSHKLDQSYAENISLTQLRNGQSIDSRCYPELQQMMDDCRAQGYSPIICSSYRTHEKQQELFNQQIQIYMKDGMDRQEAEEKTAKSVAIPGTSEHELGLAVDITDIAEQKIVSGMEEQPVQQWLMKNCWKYGFILRYPEDKADITGIVYEPWHYRYVGKEAAKYIYSNQITLEEYCYHH